VIAADLGTPEGIAQLADTVRARGLEVSILVNNAGFGLLGRRRRSTFRTNSRLSTSTTAPSPI